VTLPCENLPISAVPKDAMSSHLAASSVFSADNLMLLALSQLKMIESDTFTVNFGWRIIRRAMSSDGNESGGVSFLICLFQNSPVLSSII
jgi:hypothetical protein